MLDVPDCYVHAWAMSEATCEAYSRIHGYGPEYSGEEEGNHGMTNHAPVAAGVIVRRDKPAR